VSANTYNIGDGATLWGYSDGRAATVIAVTACTVTVREDKATLLNGCDSGAPDALVCTPGGFAGHVEGTQRYDYAPDAAGAVTVCRLRKAPRKVWTEGAGENGAYGYVERPDFRGHGKKLTPGRTHHYDFNL
jgi:hypothetical protein